MTELQERLFSQSDAGYRDFQAPLLPNVARERIIGVRVPVLRRMAKALCKTQEADALLESLPHFYYEENMLHAFLIEQIRDFDACIAALDRFLPHVDNWGVCDSLSPKILGKHKSALLDVIARWLDSPHPYAVRFGIKMLMTWFLDADFDTRHLSRVAAIRSDEYYVNMMVAWYFATALAKQPAATLPYLKEHRLTPWIHQKTVRKAIESYRVSDEIKAWLRTI
ncbi:MAG: DNA alkylation repair protein [Clostridia bacterium]|nr:DNA alkylation repair protein [Clostridia bacterium]